MDRSQLNVANPKTRPTNVSLSKALVAEAKALDVNISQAAEAGLAEAVAEARAARWKEENREAILAYNAWVAEHGLVLADMRRF